MVHRPPLIDLFSGIGGFSLALKDIFRTTLYCEIDPFCRKVLTANMQSGRIDRAPIHDDVTTIMPIQVKGAHAITAGFPCQDISSASYTRTGLDGDRSGMIEHVLQVMRMCDRTLKIVILENSINIKNDPGFDALLLRFDKLGYDVAWANFPASSIGALHVRYRWFAVLVNRKNGGSQFLNDHAVNIRRIAKGSLIMQACKQWADWRTLYPPNKLFVPKRSVVDKATDSDRKRVLGNSIVPQVAVFALSVLATAFAQPTDHSANATTRTHTVHTITNRGTVTTKKVPCVHHPPAPLPNLEFRDDKGNIERRKYWSTPAASKWSWVYYKNMTYRSTGVIQNQMLYQHRPVSQQPTIKDSYLPNVNFIEFLMGYPRNFTQTR